MRRAAWAWVLVTVAVAAGAACSTILGIDPPPAPPDGGAATGGGGTTTTATTSSTGTGGTAPAPVCAALDAGLGADATVEAGTYSPLGPVTDGGGTWDWFDLRALKIGIPSFLGGTFDGQYVYYAGRGGALVRYDTQEAFDDPASWETFNADKIPVPATAQRPPGGFSGAVFDGRYVYYVPSEITAAGAGIAARFDTQLTPPPTLFDAGAAWTSFDVTTVTADAGSGFFGGAFDGRFLYLVPGNNGTPDGLIVRYDTGLHDGGPTADAGFGDPTLWKSFDLTSVDPRAKGFAGAVFDGTSVYLVPLINDAFGGVVDHGQNSTVAELHASDDFASIASWTTYDLTNVNGLAYNFIGAGFDGRYVYLAPNDEAIVLRYDPTAGPLGTPAAWSTYDVSRLMLADAAVTRFEGTAFDGRFLYFIPSEAGFGKLVRYDTLSTFTADCAWSAVDLTTVTVDAGTPGVYAGAVFDGQHLYLVPRDGTYLAARFQARTPASLPALPAFHGSFW